LTLREDAVAHLENVVGLDIGFEAGGGNGEGIGPDVDVWGSYRRRFRRIWC